MYHYLILNQSLFYHNLNPKRLKKPRKAKRTTKISQSSRPIHLVVDETVYKEWEDRMERAATTASSLVAEQDSGHINRTQFMATLNESFLQETGSGSGPRCQDTILRVQKLKLVICPIAVKVNPTLFYYMYCNSLEYAKVKTVNGECQIQAPSRTRKGTGKNGTTSWNEFSSTMASAITYSAAPSDSHSTPIISQPSSSKPQKKKSRRKQRKDSAPTEPTTEETPDEAHVSTPSYDPPQSGEDSMQLSELMNLCTSHQEKVLNLEKAQAGSKKGDC
ncbi:hypothetical protein Tco_0617920 [Tanacetum coccineum]